MAHTAPSTEERVWAVIAHLSALAFGMGTLLPVLGWSEQRQKSKYAAFQSLQALGYQSLGYTIWILVSLILVVAQSLIALSKLLQAVQAGADINQLMTLAMGGQFVVTWGLIALYLVFPIIGAVACVMGRDFRYPLMGNRLARYVESEHDTINSDETETTLNEDHADRWVAAMGHFCVIIVLWGILVPLTTWILQSKRSLFLKFQTIQTLAYQVFVTLLFFVAAFIYMFGVVVFLATIGISGDITLETSTGIAGVVVFLISMLIFIVTLLIIPLFHILGQWAGYRILKGDNYHYPLIGRLVEKRMKHTKGVPDVNL